MASFLEDVISGHENAMYGETGTSGLYHNSPNQTNYNINATSDLANRISQGVGSIPMAGPYLEGMTDLAMPALALGASPFYDTGQAIAKAKEKYGSSYGMVDDTEIPGGPTMSQLGTELNNQNILSSMLERSLGAATPLASKLSFNTPNFDLMGSAQASELTDLERDFPGMSTGDIIDSMNARQSANRFSGMGQSGPVKSNMNAPAIDRSNVMGEDIDAQYTNDSFQTQPSTRFRDHSNMKSYLQANPDMGKNIKNKIGSVFNQGKQGILNNPLVKGAGMAFNAATGNIPGLIMGGIGMLGNQFADKTLYGDTIDENGNVYSADQLNKMNAAGGGYTDPARSARRRVTRRISKMRARDFRQS